MTAANLLPADVQQRADAELGAAWRRCEAALPDGAVLRLHSTHHGYTAWTNRPEVYRFTGQTFAGPTPAAALVALAEALEARREE